MQPVSQLTREGLIEVFGGCPSAMSGLVVSRLLNRAGDCADKSRFCVTHYFYTKIKNCHPFYWRNLFLCVESLVYGPRKRAAHSD